MKTRIVYPQMWMDEKFAQCAVSTKLLFCYLITNQQLGLSRYLHLNDRQILFDTGLTPNQLVTGKKELTSLKWVYFTGDWIYHNHAAAYIDYDGRDRVISSKEKEISKIPQEIKEVIKGLLTGYEPVLNNKSEIINKKEDRSLREETVIARGNEKTALEANELILLFNLKFGKNYQLTEARKDHIRARLKRFSAEQLARAVENLAGSDWHRGQNDRKWSADPDFLFRSDEQVDKFLNFESANSPHKPKILMSDLISKANNATAV